MVKKKEKKVKQPIFILFYKEAYFFTSNLNNYFPSVSISLLHEYDDVFLEEISNGVPLIKGVEHKINFILKASHPNQPVYKTNLEETKKIQKQVEVYLSHDM